MIKKEVASILFVGQFSTQIKTTEKQVKGGISSMGKRKGEKSKKEGGGREQEVNHTPQAPGR